MKEQLSKEFYALERVSSKQTEILEVMLHLEQQLKSLSLESDKAWNRFNYGCFLISIENWVQGLELMINNYRKYPAPEKLNSFWKGMRNFLDTYEYLGELITPEQAEELKKQIKEFLVFLKFVHTDFEKDLKKYFNLGEGESLEKIGVIVSDVGVCLEPIEPHAIDLKNVHSVQN